MKKIIYLFAMLAFWPALLCAQVIVNPGDDLNAILNRAQGGQVVTINAGTYGPLDLDGKNFSAAKPLVVRAKKGSQVIIVNKVREFGHAMDLNRCSYIVFEDIKFSKAHRGVWVEQSNHLIFKNCEFAETGQEGVHIVYRSKYIDFLNCHFHHTGIRKGSEQWGEALYVGRGSGHTPQNWPDLSSNIWVEGCLFNHTGAGEAINLKGEVFDCTIRNNVFRDITLRIPTHPQANEGAISLDHTSELNGEVYLPKKWRANWVENNELYKIRPGVSTERIAAIYSAGTGNYIINNTIRDVRNPTNPAIDAVGIRLNNWSGDNLPCYVWNNNVSNTDDPNKLGSLGIIEKPEQANPNRPQSWYRNTPPPKASIKVTSYPTEVSPGSTVSIKLQYTVTQERDVIVTLQAAQPPFTNYGRVKTDVKAGSGTLTVRVPISAAIPIANRAYQFQNFITKDGGNWSDQVAFDTKKNISSVSNNTSQVLLVRAKGSCGSEKMVLEVNDSPVKTWTNVKKAISTYRYDAFAGGNVKVRFTNDANANGCDRNLNIDYIQVGTTVYQTEQHASRVGCGDADNLWCNGHFNFGRLNTAASFVRAPNDMPLNNPHDVMLATNPVKNGMVSIESHEPFTLTVYALNGQKLITRTNVAPKEKVSVAALAPGVYIVKVSISTDTLFTQRMVIE